MDKKLEKTQLELQDFLCACGASILEPTNSFELVRFRDVHGTHVIYYNNKGRYNFSNAQAKLAWECFSTDKPYQATKKEERVRRTMRQDAIISRDGEECFFCGKSLDGDITLEHLLPISKGGNNTLHNLVLTHKHCNHLANNMSIAEKVLLRDKLRNEALVKGGTGNE